MQKAIQSISSVLTTKKQQKALSNNNNRRNSFQSTQSNESTLIQESIDSLEEKISTDISELNISNDIISIKTPDGKILLPEGFEKGFLFSKF